MGKELPTLDQWQKSFRGGLELLDGAPNPAPDRVTPSAGPLVLRRDIAPVGVNPGDVSPYGVVDLAGNLSEWSLDRSDKYEGLRRIHGGSWASAGEGPAQIQSTNVRTEEFRDYSIGVRCTTVSAH
jgi:formylglycine-generating enzyme required for sulfatase activity